MLLLLLQLMLFLRILDFLHGLRTGPNRRNSSIQDLPIIGHVGGTFLPRCRVSVPTSQEVLLKSQIFGRLQFQRPSNGSAKDVPKRSLTNLGGFGLHQQDEFFFGLGGVIDANPIVSILAVLRLGGINVRFDALYQIHSALDLSFLLDQPILFEKLLNTFFSLLLLSVVFLFLFRTIPFRGFAIFHITRQFLCHFGILQEHIGLVGNPQFSNVGLHGIRSEHDGKEDVRINVLHGTSGAVGIVLIGNSVPIVGRTRLFIGQNLIRVAQFLKASGCRWIPRILVWVAFPGLDVIRLFDFILIGTRRNAQ
mmetsp:Transcript_34487/g.53936  ORF Transcript_34487/g.53936 Transcript_34487/m.53936 type:complete len:308 (-) Transcript_34487:859-1782(-)